MNSFQRVVKYCAMAFAIFLTVMIISGIASAVFAIVDFMPGTTIRTGNWKNHKTVDYSEVYTDVKSLDIDHSVGKLNIQVGDEFKVEAENVPDTFKANMNGGKLKVSEGDGGFQFLWFNFGHFNNPDCKITIYVPEGFIAEKAKIDGGAGNISIDGLNADRLEISAGAGNIDGSNLSANEVSVDGGVGNATFNDVDFANAEFDCGVGNLNVTGILKGDSSVNCGVGSVDLNLIGNVDNYKFKVDSGIGSVRLNGEKISGKHYTNSDAENSIEVDGGVGSVDIALEEE